MSSDANKMGEMAVLWSGAQPIVANYLRATVLNFHDAEDLVQQVAYAAALRFDEYDPERPFIPWALGIAKYKVLEYRRKTNSDRLMFGEAALDRIRNAYGQMSDQSIADRQLAVQRCIAKLPPRARAVLEMRYMQDIKPGRIAERIGATANAVSLLLSRTRKALGQCVKQNLQDPGRLND